jgi:hypothetical protein
LISSAASLFVGVLKKEMRHFPVGSWQLAA